MLSQLHINNIVDYFAKKSCLLTTGQHCTGNFLAKC